MLQPVDSMSPFSKSGIIPFKSLIVNGDMESTGSWVTWGSPNNFGRVSNEKFRGDYSWRFDGVGFSDGMRNYTFTETILANQNYRLSAWVKTSLPYIGMAFRYAPGLWIFDEFFYVTSGQWSKIQKDSFSSTTMTSPQVLLYNYDQVGTFYVDDVSLIKI